MCDLCGQKFVNYNDLIAHVRHVHHHSIMKCHECGKEFIHEKDRLHHVREEHLQKEDHRTHKWEHTNKATNPQSDVDEHMHNFGDNF
ncbi:hypothetical protein DYY65_05995 [Nitrososphaera sp. AFS]|nr:hypothetical protein [Nitrososphaera sp. AFS]